MSSWVKHATCSCCVARKRLGAFRRSCASIGDHKRLGSLEFLEGGMGFMECTVFGGNMVIMLLSELHLPGLKDCRFCGFLHMPFGFRYSVQSSITHAYVRAPVSRHSSYV